MHLYAFLKAKAAFALGLQTGIGTALFMLVMIFAPIIVRQSEKAGWESFARLMSYIGYTWLGILFVFISAALIFDLYRSILSLAGLILKKDFSGLAVPGFHAFFIPLALSVVIALYGYFEARNIRSETLVIPSAKIPAEPGSLRIVQISDVHLGLIVREERLKRILQEVRKADPDILVSTGDLVDGQIDNLSRLADLLKDIRPRYGKFAVTGNHEFYAGLDQTLKFTQNAGFRVLRGEHLNIAGILTIAGVDDPQAQTSGSKIAEKELLSGITDQGFTLLLKHRPLIAGDAGNLFDLQLSGHVHKGQIFPFSIITGMYYPVQAGYATISDRAKLYVSRGSGTWGPPIRFLSPPEVTIIDIVHKDSVAGY
jgi:hypothetical protein